MDAGFKRPKFIDTAISFVKRRLLLVCISVLVLIVIINIVAAVRTVTNKADLIAAKSQGIDLAKCSSFKNRSYEIVLGLLLMWQAIIAIPNAINTTKNLYEQYKKA